MKLLLHNRHVTGPAVYSFLLCGALACDRDAVSFSGADQNDFVFVQTPLSPAQSFKTVFVLLSKPMILNLWVMTLLGGVK